MCPQCIVNVVLHLQHLQHLLQICFIEELPSVTRPPDRYHLTGVTPVSFLLRPGPPPDSRLALRVYSLIFVSPLADFFGYG